MRGLFQLFVSVFIGVLTSLRIHAGAQSLAPGSGHGFLIDKHVSKDINCAACHKESPPRVAPEMGTCLGCHGGTYETLAAKTASDEPNPHTSHQGPIPSSSCHRVHSASQTFCNSCH
ncbi:MAG: cytochrome c3 family protein, partial [Bradyrhizobiaceae bacterium]|nr:cytochrome c3 family protein [Bradyrhizobiaceae bacterium]